MTIRPSSRPREPQNVRDHGATVRGSRKGVRPMNLLLRLCSVALVLAASWTARTGDAADADATTDAGDMRLWYEAPAGRWEGALPIGSGRLGAMIFGGTT